MNMDNIVQREQDYFRVMKHRVSNIKTMNEYMQLDESNLEKWLQVYPDGATEDDIWELAEDDELYEELASRYFKAVNNYRL